jgi:hypoxanthine phosphoribosyltransferase
LSKFLTDPGTITGVIGTVFGAFLAAVFYLLHKKQVDQLLRERTHADWGDVDRGTMDIRFKLLKDDFFPDVLICPPGTSLIVTELLAIKLENRNPDIPIHVLETQEADKPPNFIGESKDYFDVDSTGYRYLIPACFTKLKGQKALVFDDGSVTGRTLLCFKQKLSQAPYGIRVRTAALFAGHDIKGLDEPLRPDYIYRFVSISDFYMPWGHILQNKRCDPKPYADAAKV